MIAVATTLCVLGAVGVALAGTHRAAPRAAEVSAGLAGSSARETIDLRAPAVAAAGTCKPPNGPVNDNYLCSLNLNDPNTPLDHTHTLQDVKDTTNATTQADIFNPPSHGGGPEVTTCHAVTYGKTIWYDLFPQANGELEVRTSGYPNAIAVYPYSQKTFKPNLGKEQCAVSTTFPSATLVANVTKGTAYTVQIGSVNVAPGTTQMMQVKFDYAITAPKKLSAQATLTAEGTPTGVKLLGLSVQTARKNLVSVDCSGHCAPESKRNRSTEAFPGLKNVSMPAGSTLHIRVTAPKSIGVYIAYAMHKASFTKITRCTEPGKRKPLKKCS